MIDMKMTYKEINTSTSEGAMLKTAIAVIGAIAFQKNTPDQIMDVIRDIKKHPFVQETLLETMDRLLSKYQ